MVVPFGWSRFDLRRGTAADRTLDEQIRGLSALACRRLSGDAAVRFAEAVEAACRARLEAAKAAGCIDVYMLVEPPGNVAVDAALLVSILPAPAPGAGTLTPDDFGFTAESSPGHVQRSASMTRVGGLHAMREVTTTFDPGSGMFKRCDVVAYSIVIPADRRCLHASFSSRSLTEEAPIVEMFDAMASTIRILGP
jgi:hypothetical protein